MQLPDGLTPYQQLALVRVQCGFSPRLMAYDEVLRVVITDTRCGVQVRRWTVTDKPTETRLTHPRIVTQAWDRPNDKAAWQFSGSIGIDDTETPTRVISNRGGKTLDEWTDRLYWEALCGRPGNGTRFGQRDYDGVQRETDRAWVRVRGSAPMLDPDGYEVDWRDITS